MGPKLPKFSDVKEVPKSMLISMGIIAGIIIFIGLFPEYVINTIVEPASNALIGYSDYISQVVGGGI
jgi:multicomponent Na+:H+ antiporter subunit D